jgi:rod shape-determining protein MreD
MKESRTQLVILVLLTLIYPLSETWIAPLGLRLDFPFLLLFWISIRRGKMPGTFYGFFLGLIRDLADFSRLGATSLAFSLGGYLIGSLRLKIDRDNLGIRLLLLIFTYLITQAIFLLPCTDWSIPAAFQAWIRFSLPGSILNAAAYLLTLFVVHLLREGLVLLHEPADH